MLPLCSSLMQPIDMISHLHALAVGDLPLHHQDPFDRILIVQAVAEDMVLLTADRMLQKHSVKTLWCGAKPRSCLAAPEVDSSFALTLGVLREAVAIRRSRCSVRGMP